MSTQPPNPTAVLDTYHERSSLTPRFRPIDCQFDIHDEAMPEQNFSELLYQATVGAEKLCPVWDGHEIRIRALQHMTTLHLQRKLAKLVKEMVKSQKATDDQMDDLHKALKDYSTSA